MYCVNLLRINYVYEVQFSKQNKNQLDINKTVKYII